MPMKVYVRRNSAGFFVYLKVDDESEPKMLQLFRYDESQMGIRDASIKVNNYLNYIFEFSKAINVDCEFYDGAIHGKSSGN